MFVCLCKGITDSQIRVAVRDGATCLQSLRHKLSVGTQCCKCVPDAKQIIKHTLTDMQANHKPSVNLYMPDTQVPPPQLFK